MESDADPQPTPPVPAEAAPPTPDLPPPPAFSTPSFMVGEGPGPGFGAAPVAGAAPGFGAVPVAGAAPVAMGPSHPAPSEPRVRASTAFLVVLTVVSLAADLVTKGWAKARLSGFDPKAHGLRKVEVLKGHVDFIFAQNPGGAWSFLRGLPDSLRRPFFLVVSAAAIVFIVSIYQRVYRDQTAMKWACPWRWAGPWATSSTASATGGWSTSSTCPCAGAGASTTGPPSTSPTSPSSSALA